MDYKLHLKTKQKTKVDVTKSLVHSCRYCCRLNAMVELTGGIPGTSYCLLHSVLISTIALEVILPMLRVCAFITNKILGLKMVCVCMCVCVCVCARARALILSTPATHCPPPSLKKKLDKVEKMKKHKIC